VIASAGIPGIDSTSNKSISKPVDKSYMYRSDNFVPSEGIGILDELQLKALKTQIGWFESEFNYNATSGSKGGYLGKYQITTSALVSIGYIKNDAFARYGDRAIDYPSSWTGQDGMNSKNDFLSNGSLQEQAIETLLNLNYRIMLRNGTILADDTATTVGGMLCVSFLDGPAGAKSWRKNGGNQLAVEYFNMGRYAVEVLSNLD
jgi:hypothetical protein